MEERRRLVKGARRFVVKLGSRVLSGAQDGGLDPATIRRVARELARARAAGHEPVIVSSGAILAGRERLRLAKRPRTIQLKQAAAAVGQGRLMRAWDDAFARLDVPVAQVLLTREDVRRRDRYLNARNTLLTLLRLGVVPVINENDTVAVDEIQFGDNDVLSALVAGLVDARLLILLTDQAGLYTADPRRDPKAELVSVVRPADAVNAAGGAGPLGSGGMDSKVRAARMASSSGIPAVIASGLEPGTIKAVLSGAERGTLFVTAERRMDKRRQWLAFATQPKGEIHVDEGAREALLKRSSSLLPSGVRSVSGSFEAGDVVSLVADGRAFARGLTNYGFRDLGRIKGLKTGEIEAALGHKPADEVVHRDNLAVLERHP